MRWHSNRDYHGFRAYESDPAAESRSNWLGAFWKMLAPKSPPATSEVLVHNGERHFSVLGADSVSRSPEFDRRDWRVHP